MRAKRLSALVDAGKMTEPSGQLRFRQPPGRLDRDLAAPGGVSVGLVHAVPESIPDGSGSDDEQLPVGGHVGCHEVDEASEVLQPVGLAGILGGAATVPNSGVVANVARGPVMRRNVRSKALQADLARMPVADDGLASVDPHQRAVGGLLGDQSRSQVPGGGHDRSHAGWSPRSAARSA
jgi:hypothetical protein